jgi:hypothetical protein
MGLLEQHRKQPNVVAQRLHVWNVFSGMTNRTADGKYATFETWFSEDTTFGSTEAISAVQPGAPRFRLPEQFRASITQQGITEVPGDAVLSFVLYNYAAYTHIRTNHLYQKSTLDNLASSGASDSKIPQNRTIPAFPRGAVVLKTVWWPVAKDKISAMPIWDAAINPPQPTGNPIQTWARYVGVDPIRSTTVPSGETADIIYGGKTKRDSHIVGLNAFHYIVLNDSQVVDAVNNNRLLAQVAQSSFGRPLAVGDYAVLVAIHLTTKEIDDWVWATFWWHDKPSEGQFSADRVGSISGVWRNYLMSDTYDLNLPSGSDGDPHVT